MSAQLEFAESAPIGETPLREMDLQQRAGLGGYLSTVASHLANVDAEASASKFAGFVTSEEYGTATITALWTDPVKISRTHDCISSDGREHYFITFVSRGRGEMQHNGQCCILSPGKFLVGDLALPHSVRFFRPSFRLIVRIPRATLQKKIDLPRIVGLPLDASSGIGRVAARYFADIFSERDRLNPSDRAVAIETGVTLVAAAMKSAERPQGAADSLEEENGTALAKIRTIISRNLRDPGLSPGKIAAEAGISVRYLHRLFEPTGNSVAATILRHRLDGVYGDLVNPRFGELTITEIAFSWGFNDASHFSRVFAKQFGTTARQARSQPDRWRRSATASSGARALVADDFTID